MTALGELGVVVDRLDYIGELAVLLSETPRECEVTWEGAPCIRPALFISWSHDRYDRRLSYDEVPVCPVCLSMMTGWRPLVQGPYPDSQVNHQKEMLELY